MAQANEITALRFAALTNHIMALGFSKERYEVLTDEVKWTC